MSEFQLRFVKNGATEYGGSYPERRGAIEAGLKEYCNVPFDVIKIIDRYGHYRTSYTFHPMLHNSNGIRISS